MKLLRNELPLMSFVVAITILQLLPGLLLIQRRAAISAKVTPPMNMTSTVLCCLLGAPAPHCTCGIVSRSDHPAAKTRASYIRVLQSLECFLEGSYGGALSGGGGGGTTAPPLSCLDLLVHDTFKLLQEGGFHQV